MNIRLPPPPDFPGATAQIRQWFEFLWRRVRASASSSGDADATIPSSSNYHGVTALTAGRTLTLFDVNLLDDGEPFVVQDESGSAGTHNITIQRAGAQTINGTTSVTISSNYGRKTFFKRGDGKVFAA